MNKIRKAVLKAGIMFFCLCICFMTSAFAEGERYEYSQITYTNAEGPTYALSSGELNAEITVSATEEEFSESMAFIMLLYSDGKIIDASVDEKTVGTEPTPFTGSVIVPSDTENCWVNTVLWKSVGEMTPVCNSSLMPGGSSDVVKLTVDGVEIEDFDSDTYEYEYTVSMKRTTMPEVKVTTLDSGAKVEIEKPTTFPGKTVVKVTSVDGDEKTYTVKYKCEEKLVDNIRLLPEFITTPKTPALEHDLQVGSPSAADRDYAVAEVMPELAGCDYIPAVFAWGNNSETLDYVKMWKSSNYVDWLAFDLKRSATVHVLCTGGTSSLQRDGLGFTKTTGGLTTSAGRQYTTRYTKHVEVGDEPVTFITPSIAQIRGYIHVIVYDGYED